ncbi:putative methyltransferase, chloroplastic [Vitis vinifera]|uniref:Putative methyltransferase, chloroplastic n=1 Tax=Vitis vinifera TaxID=29760 RepID=A0A438E7S3_VITVI|nr:putative methyltransferase, chloroplastic [Vitis vinifera]
MVNDESSTQLNNGLEFDLFSCPVCYEPLIRKGPPGLNLPAIYRSGFKCRSCNKSYSSKDMYLDLTITAGSKDYNELQPNRTELFRSPLVSFLYERGWRQNFNQSGFPGRDEEFKMAQEYFEPVIGGLLVDVSCGSGLFSRKFAESGTYSGVVALDFSENMLRQCYDFIKKENPALATTNLALVRADVSRLPFSTGSVDAVHAGAALHCWPSPSNAVSLCHSNCSVSACSFFIQTAKDDTNQLCQVAEITRILRSGGIFVGTTFLRPSFGNSSITSILRPFRQWERSLQNYNNLTEKEIEDLCTSCGLINYRSKVQRSFIMFSAQKA